MNRSVPALIFFILFFFASITFLFLGNLNRVSADHCDSCQTTNPDWCYDPDIDEWYECGHSCGGNQCLSCEPFTECRIPSYSDNWCCNNVDQNWTPNPKGNNVCNWEYSWYWNSHCECVRQAVGESRGHSCTTRPACGICLRGQTETETRYNTNCATSTCGVNTCAREVQRQERQRTCNSDCGGWGGWSGWSTVDQYPECPDNNECGTSSQPGSSCYSPPGVTPKYRCINNSCSRDDAGGTTTDPNCGGSCSVPLPTRYRCSGSSCVVDANGPYTVSNCNNACVAPPGGCSVSWTLSNPNPPPNSSIQVKVRGLSDPQGWPNVQLWLDGATGAGSWGGIENPWPTFVYNNVPSGGGGGHTLQFRTNSGSRVCAPTQTFTTQSPPPSPPTLNAPSCPAPGTSASISWNASSGATYYWLRVDNQTANGWNGLCNGSQNPGDVCEDITSTSKSFTSIANNTYSWWVHACNSSGCSSPSTGTNFICIPPAPPTCSNTSPGTNQLTGCLWDGTNYNTADGNAPDGNSLSSPVQDTATAIDQNWGNGGPNAFVGSDTFSGRWRGNLNFKQGTYNFFVGADDGIRMRIDGATVLDDWRDTGYFERSFSRNFATAGVHLVEIDYYENGGDARATLRWVFTPPPPPGNLQVSGVPACNNSPYNVTLNWTNTNSTLWADISTNNFASYSNKNVSNQTSTAAPAGFNNSLLLNPNTTYSWRLWNGSVHTNGPNWFAPFCIPPITASCTGVPLSVNLNKPVTWSVSPSGGSGIYTYSWSGTDLLSGSTQIVFKTYSSFGPKSASVIVTSGASSVTTACSNTVLVNTPAWIQVEGDVHSQTGIKAN